MAKSILMDEIHLSILIPNQLPKPDTLRIRRVLKSTRFEFKLRHAIRNVFRRFPAMEKARFKISR